METCICAAIKYDTGAVVVGRRHPDIILAMSKYGIFSKSNAESGFLTNTGKFVNRDEGRILQDLAGIPSACSSGYRHSGLYSEDLY